MQDFLTKLSADIYLIKNLSVKVNLNPSFKLCNAGFDFVGSKDKQNRMGIIN